MSITTVDKRRRKQVPNTPAILWPAVWLFLGSVAWLGIYELIAVFTRIVPTISSLVIPNVKSYPQVSIPLGLAFVAFVVFLGWDWYRTFFMR